MPAVLLDEREHVHTQSDVYANLSCWLHAQLSKSVYAVPRRYIYGSEWPMRAVRSQFNVDARINHLHLYTDVDNRQLELCVGRDRERLYHKV